MRDLYVIKEATPLVMKVCGEQKFCHDLQYNISQFTVRVDYKSEILFYSCLTGELLHVKDLCAAMPYLIRHWFYVSDKIDEKSQVSKIRRLVRLIGNQNKGGLSNVEILTTTSCNVRCFYCYEKGGKISTMTSDTAKKVLEFIIKNRDANHVNIRWFGGEPLMNTHVIDVITDGLKQHHIEVDAKMTTNGILFNENLIAKAAGQWNVREVMITLDGTEKVYNKIKSSLNVKINMYHRVINNISILLKYDINVIIRLNIEAYNLDDIQTLIMELCARFGSDKISFMLSPLQNTRDNDGIESPHEIREKIYTGICDINESLFENGYAVYTGGLKKLSPYFCKAEDVHSIVIKPDGNFAYCLDNFDMESCGDVWNGLDDTRKRYQMTERSSTVCDKCPLLPACVHINQCVGCGSNACNKATQTLLLNDLHLSIKKEFKIYRDSRYETENEI